MSESSRYEPGAPIRGGVLICFPWFGPRAGDPSAPVHGVARVGAWKLDGVSLEAGGSVNARLSLDCGTLASPHVTHNLVLAYELRLGRGLLMALTVTNPAEVPTTFEQALHTYFAVGDVRKVSVAGLEGAIYVDKVDGAKRKTQTDALITIAGETDRLYLDTGAAVTLEDPGLGRRIRVEKAGSRSTVVWNPWVEKSKAMPDFGDDEWARMICIETANAADNAVTIPPHASHTMTAVISVTAI
jgi:glucose-6-phosphate 1-epimerase